MNSLRRNYKPKEMIVTQSSKGHSSSEKFQDAFKLSWSNPCYKIRAPLNLTCCSGTAGFLFPHPSFTGYVSRRSKILSDISLQQTFFSMTVLTVHFPFCQGALFLSKTIPFPPSNLLFTGLLLNKFSVPHQSLLVFLLFLMHFHNYLELQVTRKPLSALEFSGFQTSLALYCTLQLPKNKQTNLCAWLAGLCSFR